MARFSNPFPQYVRATGGVLAILDGAEMSFFSPGTTTPKDTFSDSGMTKANPNPVVANASGLFADIFLDGTYKVVLKDKAGLTIDTADPVGETAGGELMLWLNDVTYNKPDLVVGSDDEAYRSLTDANQGNDPTSSAANWEQLEFGRIWNTNVTYALGDQAIGSDGMLYFSLVAANSANNPTSDATTTNWRAADQQRSVDAGGTVDAITATYIPAVAALKDDMVLRVRASGANTSTTPTFAANGLTAKTIVKHGNLPLAADDIIGSDHELILVFNGTNDNYELLNPASPDVNLLNLGSVGLDKVVSGWGNFNGTGTPAFNDSLNTSGLVDNGTGKYTVTIDTDYLNTNYSVVMSGMTDSSGVAANDSIVAAHTLAVGSFDVRVARPGDASDAELLKDKAVICFVVLGGTV